MSTGDIGTAIGTVINGWLERKQIDKWIGLGAQMLTTYWVVFNGVCGGSLLAGKGILVSIACGQLTGAGSLVISWAASPITKGLSLRVPIDTLNQIQQVAKETAAVKGGNPKA